MSAKHTQAGLEASDLNPCDSLVYFSSYREYDAEADLYYGDLHPCNGPRAHEDDIRFVLPGYLSGSDYSGGALEVSNHRLFIEEFGELEGIHNVYGGYDSYGVAIRLDVWQAGADRSVCAWYGADEDSATCDEDGACVHQMRAWLDELESYPVADEDDLCQVEMEATDEAWEFWAESDFAAEIKKAFPDDIDDIEIIDSGRFRCWFEDLREKANVYWENETGNNAHVAIERVAAQLKEVGQVIEAAEETDEDGPKYGFTLELIRRVSYLPYCQTCGLLISDEDHKTEVDAFRRIRRDPTGPSHLSHVRIALQRVVYLNPEDEA